MILRTPTGLIITVGVALMLLGGCSGVDSSAPGSTDKAPAVTQLTANDTVFEANPIISPDGQWLLFESEASGNRDIWRMPIGGGPAEQLTVAEAFDSSPFWSPDGLSMVFESDRSGFSNIWILDLVTPGAEPVPVTAGAWADGSPAWSPDGSWIAYESNRDKSGGSDLWLSPVAGGEAVRLTTTGPEIYHRTADWSPAAGHLVFESNRSGLAPALFTLEVATGDLNRITPEFGYEGHPAWSPDGDTIAYESTVTGAMEIHLVPAVGGPSSQVTVAGGFWPRWSPDGRLIVFGVYGDPEPNLWSVELGP